mmetsp:Transcript_34817/g.80483  ORF Transcript_34817/g.80483 Transcript_34817/m.80483 type:complete len:124 (+) Transcript_34817:1175-1546(+)
MNIRSINQSATIYCDAGTCTMPMIGRHPGYGDMWYDSSTIANILSLSKVKELYRVTYNFTQGNCFVIHLPSGPRSYHEAAEGLYPHNPTKRGSNSAISKAITLVLAASSKTPPQCLKNLSRAL